MTFKDSVRRVGQFIGILRPDSQEEEYVEDDYDYEYDEDPQDAYVPQGSSAQRRAASSRMQSYPGGRDSYDNDSAPEQTTSRFAGQASAPNGVFGNNRSRRPPDNVVPLTRADEPAGRKHSEIILCVRRLEDCQDIINALLDAKSVFINLEDMDDVQVQRVVDVLGGASFALRGTMAKISHRTYLLAPSSVDVVNSQSAGPAPRGEFTAFRRT